MSKTPSQYVIIAAGGTGGHIYPAVALAETLVEKSYDLLWIGSGSVLERKLLKPYGWPYRAVMAKPYRQAGWYQKCKLPFVLASGICQALWIMIKRRPRFVITTGGYVSVTTTIAARMLAIPVFMCEQNSRPGLANRMLGQLAKRIFTAYPDVFPHFPKEKIHMVGNPLRDKVLQQATTKKQAQFKPRQQISLLVMGGSQGAKIFNEKIPGLLSSLQHKEDIKIIHQAGALANIDEIQQAYDNEGIQAQVLPYLDNIASYYEQTHLVIARAGALTITELVQFCLPSILIPLPNSADNHQFHNAHYHQTLGCAWLLPQDRFVRDGYLSNMVNALHLSSGHINNMRKVCEKIQSHQVAHNIITHCESQAH
ncbi:MAG: undecaprenyldiphospho-muramoylpentapeptide beta-N-acetylglucosaminyltransferase [Legionellales bacterium]|nr:undecaprenyldiphospho-muramoylpentapeptide beta-N-acetylglucosaminyltransferase [Legionellales bacterium]HAV94121.1 undecaprenyldiphospho-muramoylpentapeptide beta-N-acetylglucosaminyltransferase [Pseudomonadota bacterium]